MAKQLSAFEKEFKAARDRGAKDFDFGGKKYNTKYKEENSAPAKKTPTELEKKRDMAAYLGNAKQTAGSGTSDLAKAKIKEASESAARSYETAQKDESMKNHKPRYTPPTSAAKTTEGATYDKKPYMPEEVDMSFNSGGTVKKMASGGKASTSAGTMGAYKPRRPGTTYEDSMTSDDIKKMQAQKDEAATERKIKTAPTTKTEMGKLFTKGGSVGSASKRADGCCTKGKTKGRFV